MTQHRMYKAMNGMSLLYWKNLLEQVQAANLLPDANIGLRSQRMLVFKNHF